jgi:hypothetical protein
LNGLPLQSIQTVAPKEWKRHAEEKTSMKSALSETCKVCSMTGKMCKSFTELKKLNIKAMRINLNSNIYLEHNYLYSHNPSASFGSDMIAL